VDHRLVREHHIDHLSHGAATLYLFLITVSDAQGLSYYGDETLQKRLGLDGIDLSQARDNLVRQQLIAYKKPLYQVLALDHSRKHVQVSTEPSSMQQILQKMMGGGK